MGWPVPPHPHIPIPSLDLLPTSAFFSRFYPLCPSIPPAHRSPRGESGFAPLAGIGLLVVSPAGRYGLNLLGSPSPGEMTAGQVFRINVRVSSDVVLSFTATAKYTANQNREWHSFARQGLRFLCFLCFYCFCAKLLSRRYCDGYT